ncbi:hypothetical protein FHR99_002618 [Litorivivens lipolytica]|uniref:DUF4126 domain-containing protein n=1 Tax=Litorivivens lipolytica TaxID=1524264 RepID=A0A7W4W7H1_9GAMM|nr:hypothetical protein [Litorivivens lipolytica]
MSEFEQVAALISLSMGVAWASGLNLYAAMLVLGFAGSTGNIDLPPGLEVLQDPMVMMAAGLMYGVEFFADKTPGVDTAWDSLHTFIRIPAGALLAAGSVGDVTPALQVAAGVLGGSLTTVTHAAKASSRVMINTSPEPFTNWGASIGEDVAVFAGLWAALNHPVLFLVLLVLFILLLIWMLPKLWRGAMLVLRKLGQWLGVVDKDSPPAAVETDDPVAKLQRLQELKQSGALTQEEFEIAKARVLGTGVKPAAEAGDAG